LKERFIVGCLAAMLAGAQEKTTDRSLQKSSPAVNEPTKIQEAGSTGGYMSTDVKILGELDYGQTSGPVTIQPAHGIARLCLAGTAAKRLRLL
jgi:hypothetical protein